MVVACIQPVGKSNLMVVTLPAGKRQVEWSPESKVSDIGLQPANSVPGV